MENSGFLQIDPLSIKDNLIKLISVDWMLVTAGNIEKINTMTANWGGAGYLWNRPVVFVFVRPERYTYQFTERSEGFTLSFFDEEYRPALNICGSKSGRDCDKITEASLTPVFTELGYPAFKEAKLVIECRKLYSELLTKDAFIVREPVAAHYSGQAGIHKLYIAEIKKVWIK